MKKQTPIKLHLGALAVAMCFLWNPFLRLFDVLPDFIGYALILWAIGKIADLSPTLADALPHFRKLLCFSIARPFVQILLLLSQAGQANPDKGLPVLVYMTVFAFEGYFWVMGFRALFAGLDALAMQYDGKIDEARQKDVCSLTTVSGIARFLLGLLPELGDLLGGDYSGSLSDDAFDLAKYSSMFTLANWALVSLLGIVWMVIVVRYFRDVAAQKAFAARLADAYNAEILPQTGLFLRRGVKRGLLFLCLGCICMLDFLADGIDLLPDALAGLFFTIGLWQLADWVPLLPSRAKKNGRWLACSLGGTLTLLSLARTILSVYFSDTYYDVAVVRGIWDFPAAQPLYTLLLILGTLEALLLAALLTLAFFAMQHLLLNHTGGTLSTERGKAEEALQRAELQKKLLVAFIAAMVYCASKIGYSILFTELPIWWLWHIVFGGIFLYQFWTKQDALAEKVRYKYL